MHVKSVCKMNVKSVCVKVCVKKCVKFLHIRHFQIRHFHTWLFDPFDIFRLDFLTHSTFSDRHFQTRHFQTRQFIPVSSYARWMALANFMSGSEQRPTKGHDKTPSDMAYIWIHCKLWWLYVKILYIFICKFSLHIWVLIPSLVITDFNKNCLCRFQDCSEVLAWLQMQFKKIRLKLSKLIKFKIGESWESLKKLKIMFEK